MNFDKVIEEGEMHKRPLLAKTLETLSNSGEQAFYNGPLGEKIVAEIQKSGGIITMEDLKNYK